MTGFDLPEECPECGHSCGWFVPEEQSLFINPDGSVDIGEKNNTRWGQKIKAKCNYPECDAVVDIYIEGEAVNNGEIRSTHASDLLEKLEKQDALPKQVERECPKCGQEYVTDVDTRLATDGGINLVANKNCPKHAFSAFLVDTVEHIPPEDFEEKLDLLPEARGQ